MPKILHKVTCFVTSQQAGVPHLPLFQHPNAGTQIPAGTVEAHETPEQGALRETAEETGLTDVRVAADLGAEQDPLPPDRFPLIQPATAYARPDPASFDWIHLPRGAVVTRLRRENGFSQVTYTEHDRWPDPAYVSMQVTGWVPDDALADNQLRHFFHLTFEGRTPENWQVFTDNHNFTLFWVPLAKIHAQNILPSQRPWLDHFQK